MSRGEPRSPYERPDEPSRAVAWFGEAGRPRTACRTWGLPREFAIATEVEAPAVQAQRNPRVRHDWQRASTPETPPPDQDLSPLDRLDQALQDGLIGRGRHKGLIPFFEVLVHYAIVVVLLGIARFVIFKTVHDLIVTHESYAQAAVTAVNGVLIAIIVLEVMRTVMAHFDRAGLQPEPFLIIGIISGVRGILFVGARLSLGTTQGPPVTFTTQCLSSASTEPW